MPIKLYNLTIFISSDRSLKDSYSKCLRFFGDVYSAISCQQQDSLFKGKRGNFCSKTIKYCFYPQLKAIADS
ncbi:MAG: hypothetical protein SWX82_35735 [Cyanobacteriota bacterium]|nr:hypothetical protein [Cyanobacteriota bacterium]